ncbi:MAG: carboxypeptidase-like regulatory domain-containing protein [Terriglobales bacterium]
MRFTTSMRVLVLALVVLLLPVLVLAQSLTQGAISGTVTDATGAIVPNIIVKLTSSERGYTRETKTNAQGVFQFPLVDLGSYQLAVDAPGVGSYLGNVAVSGGHTTEVAAKLGATVTTGPDGAPRAGTIHIGGGPSKTITQFLIGGTLAASVDSKKKKAGEEVVVKTIGDVHLSDGTLIPRGAKVIGHVTEAKARAGGDPQSSLGITFDKVELKDGKTLAIAGVIRAVGPPNETQGGGGVDYGGLSQTVQHTSAGTNWGATPGLNGDSVGVIGIKGLELSSDGVLKSGDKTVKLDSGSQIILKAQLGGN